MSLDQKRFLEVVRELFDQPHEQTVNNDLPLEEPIDFNWSADGAVVHRLRLYVQRESVLAVSQSAAAEGHPWEREKRVLIEGPRAVQIAGDLAALLQNGAGT